MSQGLCQGVKRRLHFKCDSGQVKRAKNRYLKRSSISSFSCCYPYFTFKYFTAVTVGHTIFQFQYKNQQFAK